LRENNELFNTGFNIIAIYFIIQLNGFFSEMDFLPPADEAEKFLLLCMPRSDHLKSFEKDFI
jgi:hypothetical protein